VGRTDSEIREITRAEIARLHEAEVQARASAKLLEKELADLELKLIGMTERERILRERGDAAGAASAGNQLQFLTAQRDLAKKQLAEANASAARARAMREQRRTQGEELANQVNITTMQETLAGIQAPFDATDPAATIDEMRARLARSGASLLDDKVGDADREMEAEQKRARVDDALARYKEMLSQEQRPVSQVPPAVTPPSKPIAPAEEDQPDQEKTLGPAEGPVRPVD
jgi:hypothetical protein